MSNNLPLEINGTEGKLHWKVHTPNLIKEITNCAQQPILRQPLIIFRALLEHVAERAIELNDEELNKLMLRLTLYEQSDPESKDYDAELMASL